MRSAIVLSTALLAACASETAPATRPGRLTARPRAQVSGVRDGGEKLLGIGGARDGRLYVPRQNRHKYPVMVLLHGAHGAGERIERRLQDLADQFGFIIVAPDSRGQTWDVIRNKLGPDVDVIDRVLREVFARYPVDAAHVAVAGFSDGASYGYEVRGLGGCEVSQCETPLAEPRATSQPRDLATQRPRLFASVAESAQNIGQP